MGLSPSEILTRWWPRAPFLARHFQSPTLRSFDQSIGHVTSPLVNRISWSGGRAVRARRRDAPRSSSAQRDLRVREGRGGVTVKQELYLYANITSEPTPVCVFSAFDAFALWRLCLRFRRERTRGSAVKSRAAVEGEGRSSLISGPDREASHGGGLKLERDGDPLKLAPTRVFLHFAGIFMCKGTLARLESHLHNID
ncbi:unnamed protein product, partial [Iphiclides podalirius]